MKTLVVTQNKTTMEIERTSLLFYNKLDIGVVQKSFRIRYALARFLSHSLRQNKTFSNDHAFFIRHEN